MIQIVFTAIKFFFYILRWNTLEAFHSNSLLKFFQIFKIDFMKERACHVRKPLPLMLNIYSKMFEVYFGSWDWLGCVMAGWQTPPATVENKHHVSILLFLLLYSFSTSRPPCQKLIPDWQTWWGHSFLSEGPSRSVFRLLPLLVVLFIAAIISSEILIHICISIGKDTISKGRLDDLF